MEKKLKDNDLEKVTGGGVGTDPLGRDTNPAFKNNNYINYGTCTTCGMPLLADKCIFRPIGKLIPPETG